MPTTDDAAMEAVRLRTHPWQSVLPWSPETSCICARCGLVLPGFFLGHVPVCTGGPLPMQDA